MVRFYYVILILSVISCGGVTKIAPPIESSRSANFNAAPCMFDLPIGATEGENIECGYLTVPEHHHDPTGKTIELAVAIIKTNSETPAPDPIFMAQGGPGGSTLDSYADLMFYLPLDPDRDIVLFDQRGTLHSKPFLDCPEVLTSTIETIGQNLTITESNQQSIKVMAACHDRLRQEGVNLGAFNSYENAADVESLRVALSYEQINFYGVSYGTLLGLHLMQNYPQSLRSVILDAVVPRQTNFITESPYSTNRAFSHLFEACNTSVTCHEAYPDLEQKLFALVTQLNEKPVQVTLTDKETGQHYQALLTGDQLMGNLFEMLYVTDFIPMLPMLIDEVAHGNYSLLATVWSLFAFDRTMSEGMYNSVICAEDADFTVNDLHTQSIRPQIAKDMAVEYAAFLQACTAWQVPPLGPAADDPVVSNIPTLLLSGQFDPITPPDFAATAAKTLSHSYSYTFPTNGHGAQGRPCANEIIQNFITNPNQTPNSRCLAQAATTPTFLTSATVLPITIMPDIMLNLPWQYGLEFVWLWLSGLGLLSAWLLWPFITLLRWLNNRPTKPSPLPATLLRGLALFTGLLSGLWLVGMVVVLGYTFYVDLNMALVGVPYLTAPLFILPLILLFLTFSMVGGCLISWLMGYWSIWGRLYYTMLTLLAVSHVAVLAWWGMLRVLV